MTTWKHPGPDELSTLDDDDLYRLAAELDVEQRRRALISGDPVAIADHGFEAGFATNGQALDPWLEHGLLVCPGSLVEKSGSSHDCSFVSIAEPRRPSAWVWEAGDIVHDDVRYSSTPRGGRTQQRSVTVVVVVEGTEVDVVVSKMRSGEHKMQQVRSFVVRNGALEHVSTRAARTPSGHR